MGASIVVYIITNNINDKEYIGITRTSLKHRWAGHKCIHAHKTTPLYNAMKKHGIGNFSIKEIVICPSWEYACYTETELIKVKDNLYNIAPGGEGGYVVPPHKREVWTEKLKAARVGRKPALGMKHTKENKELFSKCSKRRWEGKKYPIKVTEAPFREANKTYGISKTHYYRLRKHYD